MSFATDGALAGARIAVTGANRGIGRALADAFASAGARLVLHAREPAAAAAVADALGAKAPGRAIAVAGDLRDPELGARLADAALGAFGGLDALVLNAGQLGPMQPLADTDFAAFRAVMEVNVDAQARLFVATLPLLRESRGKVIWEGRGSGRVIWMTSGLGHFALPGYGVYCVSKHAVEGLAKLAHADHGGDGIVSVAVAPGMVRTEMLTAATRGDVPDSAVDVEVAGARFVRLLAGLGPDDGGKILDLTNF
ncbi:MAG: SDR family oxidoreductase [Deltaproteobacteria bacterium]|nr:SDR family oxidoreductase [Deltaproteobacteria bacterium]